MDCRISLILGLGLGILGGGAGCAPSFISRTSTTTDTPTANSSRKLQAEMVVSNTSPKKKDEKELPKRKPKAMTCVTFGDFRWRESLVPGKSPQEQRQMRDQARQAYQQALKIDPACMEAHRGLARLSAADEDYERAIPAYRAALRCDSKSTELWFELGMCHSRRKEWEQSIDALAHASELDPDNRQLANILGYCLARAGRYEQSLAYFTRVVGEAKAHYNVGRMMIHLGQSEQGRVQLQLALQKEPNLAEARDMLAEIESGKIQAVQYEQPPQR